MRYGLLSLCVGACFLASCGGQPAHPVKTVQAGDSTKDCAALLSESQSIDSRAKGLIAEFARKQHANSGGLELIGVLFPPALLGLDLGTAEKTEFKALVERNKQVSQLAAAQGCPPIKVKTFEDYKQEMVTGG